ncbi:hypothetical protein ULMS_04690 [Patiriisocius marinistellae]|uniref:Uncharacterized protein n=1 Tax=Patiriisocius marinistellae TaxID=2494560 RepID=A0A5J4FZ53_9FLAO|nr:DUF5034 domain-containing protein [Patiriisocius marinistellae]GEQ84961.1 hypothetical protein ULMS_04690 [Patiriisocius marinistellae]
MNNKVISILIIFLIAPLLYMCTQNDDDCNCSPIEGSFFDIKGLDLINTKTNPDNSNSIISENDVVMFNEYDGMFLNFDVTYLSNHIHQSNPFISSAYACSCLWSGHAGSKTEMFESIDVVTLNDFDESHLANQSINDLLKASYYASDEGLFIEEFIENDTLNVQGQSLKLSLIRKPVIDSNFKVKVTIKLSNGEIYEQLNKPFILQ